MPLKILYLLPDHGIRLADSDKGASIHARAVIDALTRESHHVTVCCMRVGRSKEVVADYALRECKPGPLTTWFIERFIRPGEATGESPRFRLMWTLAEAAVTAAMILIGLRLLAPGVMRLAEGGMISASAVLPGIALLAGAGPCAQLVRRGRTAARARRINAEEEEHAPPNFVLALFTLLRQWDFYLGARDILSRGEKPDFIYARNAWFAWPVGLLARRHGVPLVLEVNAIAWQEKEIRGEGSMTALARRIERANLREAALVLPVTEVVKRHAVREGSRPDRTITSTNGVDVRHFGAAVGERPLDWTDGRFVVGMVCSFRPFHGVELLLEAAGLLKERIPNLLVWILGNGPGAEKARRLIRDRELTDLVRLEGVMPYERLPRALISMNVAAAPYRGEHNVYGSPMKIYEYMAARRPIVAAKWGVVPTVLTDRTDALLHETDDAGDLAARILEIHDDPALGERLAAAAYEAAQAMSWSVKVREMIERLEEFGIIRRETARDPVSTAPSPESVLEVRRRESELHEWWGGFERRRARRVDVMRRRWRGYERRRDEFLRGRTHEVDAEGLSPRPYSRIRWKSRAPEVVTGPLERALYNLRAAWLTRIAAVRERRGADRRRAPDPDRPLRVVRLSSSGAMGGVAKVMLQTLLNTNPEEVQTTLILFGPKEHLSRRLKTAPGIHWRRVPMELWFPSWDRRVFQSIRKLRRILESEEPDIVHLHEPQFAPAVRIAAAPLGIPVLVHLHSAYSTRRAGYDPLHVRLERRAMADLPLVACSTNMIEDAYRHIGWGTDRASRPIDLVEDGVDDLRMWSEEKRLGEWINARAGDRSKLLLTGRFIPLKRIPDYMAACRLLLDEGERIFMILVAYGKTREMRKVRDIFHSTFRPGEGELLYHVASPADLMPHVTAGVSCSSLEGLPVTLLEYMRHGVPVVCSDISAHRQLIRHGHSGLMFGVGDIPDLVRQLRTVLHDAALRESMIREARESVAHRKWSAAAAATTEIYRRILHARAAAAPPEAPRGAERG